MLVVEVEEEGSLVEAGVSARIWRREIPGLRPAEEEEELRGEVRLGRRRVRVRVCSRAENAGIGKGTHTIAHHNYITSHHITSHQITSHHITAQHITSHHIIHHMNEMGKSNTEQKSDNKKTEPA